MPQPVFSLATSGTDPKSTTLQILETEMNRVLGELFDQANPEDRVAAETSAVNAAASALAAALSAAAALNSQNVALAAANAAGPTVIYATRAAADAALAGLANGTVIEVGVDESRGNRRSRYQKTGGVYVFQLHLDQRTVFDNVAAMVAETTLAIGQNVRVLGQTLRGVGACEYRIVAAGTGTADGDTFINLTGITGQAQRQGPYSSVPVYLDSVAGNDSFSGLSANRPKQTVAGLLSLLSNNLTGADIRIERNSVFFERLWGSAGSNWCRVSAYGAGRKPIFDSRDTISAGSWSKTAGYTNIYQVTWTPTNSGQVAPSLWENGVRLRRVADLATLDATPGSYFASTTYTNGVAAPLYIHATGSTNPGSNGRTYQQATRLQGVSLGDYSSLTDVRCIGAQADNGTAQLGRFSFMADCIFEDGTKHAVFQSSGLAINCVAWKLDRWFSVFGATGSVAFIAYNTGNQADPMNWQRCIYVFGNDNISYGDGFYAHSQSGMTSFATVAIEDCEIYNGDAFSIGVAQTNNLLIDGAIAYNTGRLIIGGGAAVSNTVRRSLWYLNRNPSELTYRGFWRSQNAGAQNMLIEDSIAFIDAGVVSNAQNAIRVAENGHTGTIRINRFLAIATPPAAAINLNNANAITLGGSTGSLTATMENVLVEGWNDGSSSIFYATMLNVGAGCTYTGRNNDFNGWSTLSSANRGRVIFQGTTYDTGALYLAAVQPGNEVGSVTTNTTQFAGDTSRQDYRLLPGGVAQNARPRFMPRYFGQSLQNRLSDLSAWLEAA